MADSKEMDEITKAINKMAIEATPNRRRSKRVLHIKAKEFVKHQTQTIQEDQEINDHKESEQNQNKKVMKAKPEQKTPKPSDIKQSISIVFPEFKPIQYASITDIFSIKLPQYVHQWLLKVLTMINTADLHHDIDAYAWIVLLYPSLLLLQQQPSLNQELKKSIKSTLQIFCEFILAETKSTQCSLNDILIAVELWDKGSIKKLPKFVWKGLNKVMESTNTFNKFLYLSCSMAKHEKFVKELLECTSSQLITKKGLYPKIREKWTAFIGVYTQIVRLHRLYTLEEMNENLSELAMQNIAMICDTFDEKYCFVMRDLLIPLIQKSDDMKRDYAYYRYKILAMCTHTATSIPATFAGYYGFIGKGNEKPIDMSLWKRMVDALQDDVTVFIETVEYVLDAMKTERKRIEKLPKKQTHALRILDNICYNSICAKLMYESYDGDNCDVNEREEIKSYVRRLTEIRINMRDVLGKLGENELLFCQEMNGLKGDILQSCFLTDENQGKQTWSVHLLGGVLLNYWIDKRK